MVTHFLLNKYLYNFTPTLELENISYARHLSLCQNACMMTRQEVYICRQWKNANTDTQNRKQIITIWNSVDCLHLASRFHHVSFIV